MVGNFSMSIIWFFLMSCVRTSTSIDSLGMSQSIRDGETLVSAGGNFELGFFSPGTSANRYLGVWYRDASRNLTVVWVANRERPLHNMSGVLIFNKKGILQLLGDTNSTIWSSNIVGKALNNSIVQLLDSGNLVVRNKQDNNKGSFLWQSFDYPCDTMMPGMKLGLNLVTGLDRSLSCWKSPYDPTVGEYSIKIYSRGYPQVVQMKGSVIITRAGPWNGLSFSGYSSQVLNIFGGNFVVNDKEIYYELEMIDRSIFSIYRTITFGRGQILVWTSQTRTQVENIPTEGQDRCESYAFCGSNSICNMDGNFARCECLKGYVPKFPKQWNMSHWGNGCLRKTALDCNNTDGFLRYTDMKLPDTSSSWYSLTMNLEECQKLCLKNCSCTAYANMDIRQGGSGCLLWFDYLVDMRQYFKGGQDLYVKVPASELGMKLGWDLVTEKERFPSSWKSKDDPPEGEYFLRIVHIGYPQFFTFKGSVKKFRGGSWNGVGFSGYPTHQLTQYRSRFIMNAKEVYYECDILDRWIVSIYTLTPSGLGQTYAWTSQTSSREVISTGVQDECENYALCGVNSICNLDGNLPKCECLKGYVPKFPEQWNISYWSNGCIPRNKSNCNSTSTDGFWRYTDMKLPDTSFSWFSKTMSLEDCRKACLENCSCTSYANLDIRNGGSGCLVWFDDMVDMRKFSQWGQDLYIRVPASELDHVAVNGHRNKKMMLVGITVGVIILGLTTCVCALILKKRGVARIIHRKHYENILKKEDIYLPTFDLPVIVKATENFSSSNKLGEGGFGPVYKGTLTNGQELAVKRLSKNSGQGLEEFKNEVVLIAKLQHRNLVKLLGCCIEEEEIMLVYEYMPYKSLDKFIFDETRRQLLEWHKRFNIICGIARGLLYLHQDSRLRIIHRDLKTSNILLDANLDPKISDFGLARTLLGDQVEANTTKVAGTYGYMPPEYAVRGNFSIKSDVFSYGVIVLEIVSGKKNREFSDPEHCHNLLGHAWRLWTEGKQLELLDEVLGERCTPSEVTRCIQVGLLCVQQRPEDRLNMSSVVLMLNGEKLLPNPKVPAFYIERDTIPESNALLANCTSVSPNEISMTMLDAR